MSVSKPLIKLTRGVPPAEAFPTAQLSECATAVLAEHGDVVLQYGPSGGFPPLRAIVAQEAGVDDSQVIVGQGSLQLLDLLARMMIQPGDVVYIEEPSYDRTLTVLRRAGGQVVGWPLAEDGPDVDAVAARLKGGERPVLFYLIPDFQNPSGTVLSLQKRQRIADLAREYGFAPDSLAGRLAKMAEDTYINASYLNQAMVADFIQRGWLEPNIARLKALYTPRLDAMLGALDIHVGDMGTWRRPEGGFFVGMMLQGDIRAEDLLKSAREANLLLTDGRGFFVDGSGDRFVRLPFCALTPDEIEAGVARLAQVVHTVLDSSR
jgi:2-aminoadipate transaminase